MLAVNLYFIGSVIFVFFFLKNSYHSLWSRHFIQSFTRLLWLDLLLLSPSTPVPVPVPSIIDPVDHGFWVQCKVCMQTFICTTTEVKCREHAEAKHPKSDVYACFPHLKKWCWKCKTGTCIQKSTVEYYLLCTLLLLEHFHYHASYPFSSMFIICLVDFRSQT